MGSNSFSSYGGEDGVMPMEPVEVTTAAAELSPSTASISKRGGEGTRSLARSLVFSFSDPFITSGVTLNFGHDDEAIFNFKSTNFLYFLRHFPFILEKYI